MVISGNKLGTWLAAMNDIDRDYKGLSGMHIHPVQQNGLRAHWGKVTNKSNGPGEIYKDVLFVTFSQSG